MRNCNAHLIDEKPTFENHKKMFRFLSFTNSNLKKKIHSSTANLNESIFMHSPEAWRRRKRLKRSHREGGSGKKHEAKDN